MVWFMVFNATFNNTSVISWRSVLLVEEAGGLEEIYSFDFVRSKNLLYQIAGIK